MTTDLSPADVARFLSRLPPHAPGSCTIWPGRLDRYGYGQFKAQGKVLQAHRVAWIILNGPIPPGSVLLHSCDNPACVNAQDHLSLGSQADNIRDMVAKGRAVIPVRTTVNLTHCSRGHALSRNNLYVGPDGARRCLKCRLSRKPRR